MNSDSPRPKKKTTTSESSMTKAFHLTWGRNFFFTFYVCRTFPTKISIGMRSVSSAVIARTLWLINLLPPRTSVSIVPIVMTITLPPDVMDVQIFSGPVSHQSYRVTLHKYTNSELGKYHCYDMYNMIPKAGRMLSILFGQS